MFTSKLYTPDISWTKRNAWWIKIPKDRITSKEFAHLYLLCRVGTDGDQFHILKVPRDYLEQNVSQFGTIGEDKINLFLSAEQDNLFEDERGSGKVNFSSFLIALQ